MAGAGTAGPRGSGPALPGPGGDHRSGPGPRRWVIGPGRRGPLVTLIVASVLLVGSVTAVAATGAFRHPSGTPGWGPGTANQGWTGTGMMGGTRNRGWTGPGMMGGPGTAGGTVGTGAVWLAGDGTAVTSIAVARQRAGTASASAGLHPGEVIQFDNGFYVELKDSTGASATEVIVDPRTGAVTTEPGPAMMWNTRYGMHAGNGIRPGNGTGPGTGMMGRSGYGPGMMGSGPVAGSPGTGTGTVTADQARADAQRWLDANRTGQTAQAPDSYPGYYTMETTTSGTVSGMLSVNAGTGAVWYHTWHGRFLGRED